MQKKTSLLGNLPLSHEKGEAGDGKKKHQERFPVVIRLPISNETIPDILCEIKIAITFECQADSNKSFKQNICLENYSKFNTSYCFSHSYRTAGYTIPYFSHKNCPNYFRLWSKIVIISTRS